MPVRRLGSRVLMDGLIRYLITIILGLYREIVSFYIPGRYTMISFFSSTLRHEPERTTWASSGRVCGREQQRERGGLDSRPGAGDGLRAHGMLSRHVPQPHLVHFRLQRYIFLDF